MTALAPASASISAEISPVWAPEALGWQSCAPIAKFFAAKVFECEPRALSAKAAISVAGGQTSRSALPATPGAPASMASNSAIEAFRPFIFQLPAISGRMVSVISGSPRIFCYACASRGRASVPDTGFAPSAANRLVRSSPPRLRRGGCHFMMLYQLGEALLRNSIPNSSWARTGSLLTTSWTHASRNAESLIKLARQNHHGRGDGRFDHQFRCLGHSRHFQGIRTVDAGQGRSYRNFGRTIPPALHRQVAADRAPVRPPADDGAGPCL